MIQGFFPQDPLQLFKVYLMRQGWTVTQALTYDTDPKILKVPYAGTVNPHSSPAPFHEFLSDRTLRELLRAVFSGSSRESLLKICANEKKLDAILSHFETDGIAVRTGDNWEKGPTCAGINDLGATLEWLVAEWLRSKLLSPAFHGVCIEEVSRGGNLDVVAMINDLRLFVECKSGSPQNVSNVSSIPLANWLSGDDRTHLLRYKR